MIKRIVKIILSLILILFIIYSSIWFISLKLFSRTLNQTFAHQQFAIDETKEYFVSFDKTSTFGFLFEFGVAFYGVTEDGLSSQISYLNPVKISYSLLSQNIIIQYSGRIDGVYKPLVSNFGSSIVCKDNSINLKLPISFALIKTLISSKSSIFEIVNFIDAVKQTSKGVEIRDKVTQELLYNESFSTSSVKFNHPKYVRDMPELLDNFPNKFNIFIDKNIEQSVQVKKIVAPTSILYGIFLPIAFNYKGEINFTSEYVKVDEILNNYTLEIKPSKFANQSIESDQVIRFTKSALLGNQDYNFIFESQTKLNVDFFKNFFTTLIYFNIPGPINDIKDLIDLDYLTLFENNNYSIKINFLVHKNPQITDIKINNISIFDDVSGFQLSNTLKISKHQNNSIGTISLSNYEKISEIVTKVFIKNYVNSESFLIYKNTIAEFSKNISEYPNSVANDLIINFDVDFNNYFSSKIGNYKIKQLNDLFLSLLYNNVIKLKPELKTNRTQIFEMFPQLKGHDELIKIMEDIHSRTDK